MSIRHLVTLGTLAVLASADLASAQTISAIPTAQYGGYPSTFFAACNNMGAWPTVAARTSGLGTFNGDLSSADDATLSTCISNITAAGMTLTIEAAPFQGSTGCGLVDSCYPAIYNTVSRLAGLGLSVSSIRIRMQEPLTVSHQYPWSGNDGDVVNQVVTFLTYLRSDFPGIQVSSVEAFPFISKATLQWWIAALTAASNGAGVAPPDAFEIDHDLNANGWGWPDIAALIGTARSNGWVAGYIFGSPRRPNHTWGSTALSQGGWLQAYNIVPDAYVFESWETDGDPIQTVPEDYSTTYSFTSQINKFIAQGYFPW